MCTGVNTSTCCHASFLFCYVVDSHIYTLVSCTAQSSTVTVHQHTATTGVAARVQLVVQRKHLTPFYNFNYCDKHSNPRFVEMETEIEQLKRENETLKREIAELRETNNQLKQSRDEATRRTRPQPAPRGLKPSNTRSQASSETADSSTDSELKHENETLKREIAKLRETNNKLKESLVV